MTMLQVEATQLSGLNMRLEIQWQELQKPPPQLQLTLDVFHTTVTSKVFLLVLLKLLHHQMTSILREPTAEFSGRP